MAATAPFHFDVDKAHNKKYDEYYQNPVQLQVSSAIIGVFFIVIGVVTAYKTHFTPVGFVMMSSFIVVGIVFFAIAAIIPKRIATAQNLYDTYPLAAATITAIDNDKRTQKKPYITLTAFVDAATKPEDGPIWALATRTVKALPGHKIVLGERVPVVAVPGRRGVVVNRQHWADMTISPVAWGTTDTSIIHTAADKIPQASWRKLKHYSPRYGEAMTAKSHLLILDK